MAIILLATVKDVKRVTNFNGTLDEDKIVPFIKSSQDTLIQGVLGTKLYEAILNHVKELNNNSTPIPEPYATLLTDYITPSLAHRTAADFIPFHAFNIANGGISQHQPDNAITPDLRTVEKLSKMQEDRGDHYLRRMQDYLCHNSSDFPEYKETQEGGMYPDSSNRGGTEWVF